MAEPRMSAQLEPEDLSEALGVIHNITRRVPVSVVMDGKQKVVVFWDRPTGDETKVVTKRGVKDTQQEDETVVALYRKVEMKHKLPFEERVLVLVPGDAPAYRERRARIV